MYNYTKIILNTILAVFVKTVCKIFFMFLTGEKTENTGMHKGHVTPGKSRK